MIINELNLIVSGTGTGKSYYIANNLIQDLKEKLGMDVEPSEILFVSSRRGAIDQQVKQYKGLEKFSYDNLLEFDITTLIKSRDRIPALNYHQFAYDLKQRDSENKRFIDSTKVIVFDEIHSIIADKHFISQIEDVRTYIEYRLENKDNTTYFIGMTATDDLINEDTINVEVNDMLDTPLHNYKVSNIWTTTLIGVFPLRQMLEGNSIVMTSTVKQAKELQEKIGSCTKVIVSKYNDEFTEEMDELINYININKALPQDVKVLIIISCMREGISLEPNDNFKIDNVVVYGGTIVNVIQFVGRYRCDIENLCIVDYSFDKGDLCEEQQRQLDLFKDYMYHRDNINFHKYAKYLLPICKDMKVIYHRRFGLDDSQALFIEYIVEEWLGKLIWNDEQKDMIVSKANDLGIGNNKRKYKFKSIIDLLKMLGFDFEHEGKQVRISNKFKEQYSDIDFGEEEKVRPYQLSDNENNRSEKSKGIS